MNTKIILRTKSGSLLHETGKTEHRYGIGKLPCPTHLKILQYAGDNGFYLLYFDKEDQEMTDTYHDSMAKAIKQANWEFGLTIDDWESM